MPLIIPANSITGGYEVDNSLRFDDGSSDTLTRTVSTSGNRKTFTYSGWIKRGIVSAGYGLFGQGNRSNSDFDIRLESDGKIRIEPSGFDIKTNAQYRDCSAWYHIVLAVDTTQATDTNRVKLYVNGEQITSLANTTYPTLNYDTVVNSSGSTGNVVLGDIFNATGKFDGYMAEVVLIDGTALEPTSFGEFDEDTGIWKPIDVSGLTFGTNGFYLDFENSGSLGADVSGNGNNFTVNNLTSIDQTTDTPTNNFATLNPIGNTNDQYANFSEGNLKVAGNDGSNAGFINSTIAPSQGKWYMEFKAIDIQGTSYPGVGMISSQDATNNDQIGNSANSVSYRAGGTILTGGSVTDTESSYTDNDIIGIAMDLDNGAVYFSKNGTFQNSGDPTSGASKTGSLYNFTPSDFYHFATTVFDTTAIVEANFGNPPFTISSGNSDGAGFGQFEYAPPSGYLSLCTKNLATDG
jgi:hypothetical protein